MGKLCGCNQYINILRIKNQARKNYRRPGYKGLKNSFYSNLMMMSKFYNLPEFDPIFLTDAKFKHYANLMQQK